jgi:Ca-activated chloride channel family protein
LIFLIARPQWVDSRSKVKVDGVDTILTIDISGSMQVFDDLQDRRKRIDVAKEEAVRYIDRRPYDPIGVVVFGATAISRCPLTLDKNILKEVIGQLRIGFINENGTSLGTAFALSINRLRNSKSKNKVIILLTDGIPTPEVEEISVDTAISMAKKFKIKVYTIGIGGDEGGFIDVFGGMATAGIPLDMDLLNKIARETGGKAFRAKNPKDLRRIYDAIDSLEKTEIETNLFHNYYEAYKVLLWVVMLLLLFEVALRLFVWRGISC